MTNAAGTLVYAGSFVGRLFCISVASGNATWAFDFGNSVRSSPLVVDALDTVFCAS